MDQLSHIRLTNPRLCSAKNIGKSLVFGPGALSSSKLFKKLSDQNKEADDVVPDSPEEESGTLKDSIDVFMSDSFVAKKTPASQVSQETFGENSDIFGDLTVDRAFTENTLKNAQKVNKNLEKSKLALFKIN